MSKYFIIFSSVTVLQEFRVFVKTTFLRLLRNFSVKYLPYIVGNNKCSLRKFA